MIPRHSILGTVFAVCVSSGTGFSQWTPVTPFTVPPAAGAMAMTYDASRQQTVMFGGAAPAALQSFANTWVFDGSDWTLLSPVTSPPGRSRCHMVHDAALGLAVLYGGIGASNATLGDTWLWNGADWVQDSPVSTPGARHSHAMAYDAARGRVVLHGGIRGGLAAESDTWEYNGVNWTRTVATAPTGPRAGAAMCYSARLGKTVLFGGVNPFTGGFNDTWTYDGATWVRLNIAGPVPSPREDARMVYDAHRGVCVMHGGILSVSPFTTLLGDTWEFDGTSWKQIGSDIPTPRIYCGMAWDTVRRRIVSFGGLTSATNLRATDQTWELSGYLAPFGTACAGTNGAPVLRASTPPRLGTWFTLDLTNLATTSGLGAIALGASATSWSGIPLPLNLTPLGATGCTLYASLDQVFIVPVSALGTATLRLVIPNAVYFYGVELFAQGISIDLPANPAGLVLSNAGRLSIGQ